MIRICHSPTLFILLLLIPLTKITAESAVGSILERIEQQTLLTRNQLTQASLELRDAKVLAAEKMMEYEDNKDAFQLRQDDITTNAFDHAQQRLALAEMGVESKAARFTRIQRKLEELAHTKQEILASPSSAVAAVKNREKSTAAHQVASARVSEKSTTGQSTPPPPENAIRQQNTGPQPVLTQHGKVSDIYQLNTELQNLEHHLITQGARVTEPIQAKIYGTAIAGEIALTEMGGNQFFAKFPAPAGTASIIVGARHGNNYVRSELKMTFSPAEAGKDFVLIFDINTQEQPRALVFQESLAFTQEMFASHSNF
jgi:hypothetical protein